MMRAKTPTPPKEYNFLDTLGINGFLHWLSGTVPQMQWMSNLVLDKLEANQDKINDPLNHLPPAAKQILLELPHIAWVTIALFLVNALVMFTIVIFASYGLIYQWFASILLTLTMFVMFTVAHDAAHGSISNIKWVNGLVGRLAFGTMGPTAIFPLFRYVHQMHHKFTNDPKKDPDTFCVHGGYILLPIRCFFLVPYYLVFYCKNINTRPIFEVSEIMIAIGIQVGIILGVIEKGYLTPLLMYWVIPSAISHALLGFFFDFIPHHHHTSTPVQSRYHTTSLLQTYWFLQPVLSLLLQYQDYHIIHHLYPTIPFYRYSNKWQEKQDFLLEKQITISQLTVERVVEKTKSVAIDALS